MNLNFAPEFHESKFFHRLLNSPKVKFLTIWLDTEMKYLCNKIKT